MGHSFIVLRPFLSVSSAEAFELQFSDLFLLRKLGPVNAGTWTPHLP